MTDTSNTPSENTSLLSSENSETIFSETSGQLSLALVYKTPETKVFVSLSQKELLDILQNCLTVGVQSFMRTLDRKSRAH